MEDKQPLVSVVMITYAHENYIKQAIEGVLMQEYQGKIELIVANDKSPDKTDAVVKKIIKEHPRGNSIKYTSHEINLGMMANFIGALQQAKGKYIALCEGDDYWTDSLKLQKQVEYLEENDDCVLCFHNAEVIFENNEENNDRGLKIITENREFKPAEILKDWLIPTASVLFKNTLDGKYHSTAQKKKFMYGDIILFLSLAEKGKLFGFSDYMSVYRRHDGGATNVCLSLNHFERRIVHLEEIIKVFGLKYRDSLSDLISFSYVNIFLLNLKSRKVNFESLKHIVFHDKIYLFKKLRLKIFKAIFTHFKWINRLVT